MLVASALMQYCGYQGYEFSFDFVECFYLSLVGAERLSCFGYYAMQYPLRPHLMHQLFFEVGSAGQDVSGVVDLVEFHPVLGNWSLNELFRDLKSIQQLRHMGS